MPLHETRSLLFFIFLALLLDPLHSRNCWSFIAICRARFFFFFFFFFVFCCCSVAGRRATPFHLPLIPRWLPYWRQVAVTSHWGDIALWDYRYEGADEDTDGSPIVVEGIGKAGIIHGVSGDSCLVTGVAIDRVCCCVEFLRDFPCLRLFYFWLLHSGMYKEMKFHPDNCAWLYLGKC